MCNGTTPDPRTWPGRGSRVHSAQLPIHETGVSSSLQPNNCYHRDATSSVVAFAIIVKFVTCRHHCYRPFCLSACPECPVAVSPASAWPIQHDDSAHPVIIIVIGAHPSESASKTGIWIMQPTQWRHRRCRRPIILNVTEEIVVVANAHGVVCGH